MSFIYWLFGVICAFFMMPTYAVTWDIQALCLLMAQQERVEVLYKETKHLALLDDVRVVRKTALCCTKSA